MANMPKLTEQQVKRFDEYIALQDAIKQLTEQATEIRTEIEQVVYDSNSSDDESVVLIVNDKIIEFSVVSKSFKFDYDVKQYIEETSAYGTLTVSSTAAKAALSSEQIDKYFNIEKGSRRLKIK